MSWNLQIGSFIDPQERIVIFKHPEYVEQLLKKEDKF